MRRDEEVYTIHGFNPVVRDLVKLNYPKLRNCPPFTGRQPKKADREKVDNIFFYVNFLENLENEDPFLVNQLMPVFLAGLNAFSHLIDSDKLLTFARGSVRKRLQDFFAAAVS